MPVVLHRNSMVESFWYAIKSGEQNEGTTMSAGGEAPAEDSE
jgi:hypothetical protein